MGRAIKGTVTMRILKCIKGIEKHGFRLERQQMELEKWMEQNNISTKELEKEIDKLLIEHNGKPFIKKLQELGIPFDKDLNDEDLPLWKDEQL